MPARKHPRRFAPWIRISEASARLGRKKEAKVTVEQVIELQQTKGGFREKAQTIAGLRVEGNLGFAIGRETEESFFAFAWDPHNDPEENPHHLFLC